jgi:hypothetical protein
MNPELVENGEIFARHDKKAVAGRTLGTPAHHSKAKVLPPFHPSTIPAFLPTFKNPAPSHHPALASKPPIFPLHPSLPGQKQPSGLHLSGHHQILRAP